MHFSSLLSVHFAQTHALTCSIYYGVPTFISYKYKTQSTNIVYLNAYVKKVVKKTIRWKIAIICLQINF
jgi:hypothetical protein